MSYLFLQQYWWFIVSLLGALLVFLLFVQGANSMLFSLSASETERRMIIASTGRKWELTFTTLVTFGGAFFASFPLFYSTSFGGAYWVWILILLFFVLQAVSYEFQNYYVRLSDRSEGEAKTKAEKRGLIFRWLLVLNGIFAPFLLGCAVATFFEGSNFIIEKGNLLDTMQPVISRWANASAGLDVLLDPWVWVFGLSVFFLSRILGLLYLINNVADENIRARGRKRLLVVTVPFLILFLAFFIRVLLKDGYAYDTDGVIALEPMKYLYNLLQMWPLLVLLIIGLALALYGIIRTLAVGTYFRGIWATGIGVILVVLVLFLISGLNGTAFYPSTADLQSSLTIENASCSRFTLTVMSAVSLLIPFVLAYIVYCWWSIDKKKIDSQEIENG